MGEHLVLTPGDVQVVEGQASAPRRGKDGGVLGELGVGRSGSRERRVGRCPCAGVVDGPGVRSSLGLVKVATPTAHAVL